MIKKRSLNDQVIEVILSKIKSGEIKPGERLDSQDDLALKLGVSRSTVREAFSKLASMGVIEVMHGQGTFVKKTQDYGYMDNLLSSFVIMDRESIRHILEVRKVIEQHTVQLVLEKAAREELQSLEALLSEMESLSENPEAYNQADKAFHLELARIGKNPLLFRLLSIILNSAYEQLSSAVVVPEMISASLQTKREIVDALLNGDAAGAEQKMIDHIDCVLQLTKKQLAGSPQGVTGNQDNY